MNLRTQRGFTLYELLVTVLVMGVIFGFGVPNLLEFTRNNRMAAAANDLVGAIHLARSEAIKRRDTTVAITLCTSPDPLINVPDCDFSGADADSGGGFFVWIDEDLNGAVNGGEQILLQRDDPQDITVLGDGYLRFGINGSLESHPAAGVPPTNAILYCDSRGNTVVSGSLSAARGLRISATGRPSLLVEIAEIDGLALDCP